MAVSFLRVKEKYIQSVWNSTIEKRNLPAEQILNSKLRHKQKCIKANLYFSHPFTAVWTIRWEVLNNYSAIVGFSSELVEISSEPVEISSELVLRISELLIISVFRKTHKSVSCTLNSFWNEEKGKLWIFTLIKLFVKTAMNSTKGVTLYNPKAFFEGRRMLRENISPCSKGLSSYYLLSPFELLLN